MLTTTKKQKKIVRKKTQVIEKKGIKEKLKIPQELIYEKINGKPIYYKNYKDVLNNNKKIIDIMGCSILQSLLITNILTFLIKNLDDKIYKVLSNELGLHLSLRNNLAADIAIYEKEILKKYNINDKYATIPPKIIIEVDTKADLNDFDSAMDYFDVKTKKLLDFGTEKIIWVLTKSKKIVYADKKKKWTITDWSEKIEILPNLNLSLQKIIKDEGIIKI